jgi:ferric-dicitrate binding protein FerR (iron transport regulator)
MSNERFDFLLEKYLAQALTPSEREEFQSLLEGDAELRAEYVSALTQASMLRRIHRNKSTKSARAELLNIKSARNLKSGSDARAFKRKGLRFPLMAIAALAAMVVLAVMIKSSWQTATIPPPGLSEAPPEKVPVNVTAPDLSDVIVESGKELKLAAEDYSGRKIITRERAGALVSYKDGTTIELKESARIKLGLANANKGKELESLDGRIIVNAAPQPKDLPLQVKSIHGTVSVIGTVFWLNVDKQGTRVDLLKGKVNLTRADDNSTLQLAAGQQAVIAPATALKATPVKFEDGPLLYREEFDAALKNWRSEGAQLSLGNAEISGQKTTTAVMKPIPDRWCTAALDFSRVLTRQPDLIVINFRMRSLPYLKKDNQLRFVPFMDDNVKVEDVLDTVAPKRGKYTFIRFVWRKIRIEIYRTPGENGAEEFKYRTFIEDTLLESKKVSGPAQGLRISAIDLPFEFSDLQVRELVPAK